MICLLGQDAQDKGNLDPIFDDIRSKVDKLVPVVTVLYSKRTFQQISMDYYQEAGDAVLTQDALWVPSRNYLKRGNSMDLWKELEKVCPRCYCNDGEPQKVFVDLGMGSFSHRGRNDLVATATALKPAQALSRIYRVLVEAEKSKPKPANPEVKKKLREHKKHPHLNICARMGADLQIKDVSEEGKAEAQKSQEEETQHKEMLDDLFHHMYL